MLTIRAQNHIIMDHSAMGATQGKMHFPCDIGCEICDSTQKERVTGMSGGRVKLCTEFMIKQKRDLRLELLTNCRLWLSPSALSDSAPHLPQGNGR